MPLGAPLSAGVIPRQIVTLPVNVWDGSLYFGGRLYALSTASGGNTTLLVFPNPYDLTHFSTVTLTGANLSIVGLAGDAANNCIYAGVSLHQITGPTRRTATVYRINIDTLAVTLVLNGVDLGSNPSVNSNGVIATDSTYIYFLLNTQGGVEGFVYKFRTSDGTLVATLSLAGAIPSVTTSSGTNIQLFNGQVICAGIGDAGGPWAVTCPQDLSSVTAAIAIPGMTVINDDWDRIGSNMWTVDERQPLVFKIACDLSAVTSYPVTLGPNSFNGGLDGGYSDGTYFWTTDAGGRVYQINPATGAPVRVFDDIVRSGGLWGSPGSAPGSTLSNDVYGIPGAYVVISFDLVSSGVSQVFLVPTGGNVPAPRELALGAGGRR